MIVGPPQPQRTQHSGEVLLPIANERCLVAVAAIDLMATMARITRQQLLQKGAPDAMHGLAN